MNDDEEYYPGSKTPIERFNEDPEMDDQLDLGEPFDYGIPGDLNAELYTIGALAAALNRSPVTLRAWENNGWLPIAQWTNSYDSIHARRRLYTRQQIEGMVQIASEEGVLDGKGPGTTRFPERVIRQWQDNHWYNEED